MRYLESSALAVLLTFVPHTIAHSWVQQLMVIGSDGQFTGQPGYPRNNTLRSAPGFSDLLMVHILPGQGQPSIEQRQVPEKGDAQGITPTDPMCKKTQQAQFQSNGSPRLKAAPGAMVALRFEENGHVTLPDNQPGKPPNRGNVYIYGTSQPKDNENFLDIFGVWNADGTGGDKRGKLLAVQPYDDGRCYQVNSGQISQQRQQQYQHSADQLQGTNLWCQNDILIPKDAASGKPFTIYWVWDWPTLGGKDPNLPNGKAEIYTTCMDIDVTGNVASRDLDSRQAPAGGNVGNMAIPAYVKEMASGGQSNAPAAAPPASSPAAAAPPAASSPAPAQSAPAASPSPAAAASPAAANPPAREVAPVAGPSVVTVTVTAQPSTMATQASPAQPTMTQSQAPAAAAPSAMSSLPAQLNIAPPVIGGSGAPMMSGTAMNMSPTSAPQSTAAPAVAARACAKKACKVKRSKIIH